MKKILSLSVMLGLFIQVIPVLSQPTWTPEKCLTLKNITATTISPDATKVLYAVREAVMTEDRSEYIHQIWLANILNNNSIESIQLTRGDKNSYLPAGARMVSGLVLYRTGMVKTIYISYPCTEVNLKKSLM
jgi:hypothetical protein